MKTGIILTAFAAALTVYQLAAVEQWIGVILSIVLGGYGVVETCRHARAGGVIPALLGARPPAVCTSASAPRTKWLSANDLDGDAELAAFASSSASSRSSSPGVRGSVAVTAHLDDQGDRPSIFLGANTVT